MNTDIIDLVSQVSQFCVTRAVGDMNLTQRDLLQFLGCSGERVWISGNLFCHIFARYLGLKKRGSQ